MMPCEYKAIDGSTRKIDLDAVVDVAIGMSARRSDWSATVVYDSANGVFVELRDSPPDYKGNSTDEAEEVLLDYISEAYGIDKNAIESFLRSPQTWKLVNQR